MIRSSQNSTDSTLSEENIEKLKKAERIKFMKNNINKEKNCYRKLTLILRRFCMWLYNRQ